MKCYPEPSESLFLESRIHKLNLLALESRIQFGRAKKTRKERIWCKAYFFHVHCNHDSFYKTCKSPPTFTEEY